MGWTKERRAAQSELMKSLNKSGINKKHGLSRGSDSRKTRLFRIWTGIKTRCFNTNAKEYPRYGGKGIRMVPEWAEDYKSFYEWSMNNGYSEKLSIDRIDPFGNYEPSNCRWTTPKKQANNRCDTISFEINSEIKTLSDLSEEYKVPYATLHARIFKYKWTVAKSLLLPMQHYHGFKIEEESK